MRRLAEQPGLVLALVLTWKLALFFGTTQPVPGNDSFFYDGAVVNALNGGRYCNPTLALAFPIAGHEVFAAYPPLYQAVLFGWMRVFGTSAVAAMALHQALFALYALALFGALRRLEVPARWISLAVLFLLVNTFHDRPDSLAHALGMAAIYAWVRGRTGQSNRGDAKAQSSTAVTHVAQTSGSAVSRVSQPADVVISRGPTVGESPRAQRHQPAPARGDETGRAPAWCRRWDWLAATLVVLALATSLQLGLVYLGCVWLLALGNRLLRGGRIAWAPLALTLLVPAALVVAVRFGAPRWWEGFLEHARETPSYTGFRVPLPVEILKACRTLPAMGFVALALVWLAWKRREAFAAAARSLPAVVGWSALAGVAVIVTSGLTFLTPNLILSAGYLQPLVVAIFLAAVAPQWAQTPWRRAIGPVFAALALLSSARALGMSTWGVACAADVGYTRALEHVRRALGETPPGETVAVSAAYLYEAVRHRHVRVVHSDWLAAPSRGLSRADAVVAARPARMILTPFDRYRFYGEALPELQTRTNVVEIRLAETGRVPVPDASPRLQRVLQHIAWAPVIVELKWKRETNPR